MFVKTGEGALALDFTWEKSERRKLRQFLHPATVNDCCDPQANVTNGERQRVKERSFDHSTRKQ